MKITVMTLFFVRVLLFLVVAALLPSAIAQDNRDRKGHDPAVLAYLKRLEEQLANVKPYYDRALRLYYEGQFQAADQECWRALVLYEAIGEGEGVDAKILKGEIELSLDLPGIAAQRFQELKAAGIKSRRLSVDLALSYFKLNLTVDGLQSLDEALQYPGNSLYFPDARQDFDSLRTGNIQSWRALAYCLRADENYGPSVAQRALRDLQLARDLAPANAGIKLYLGSTLRRLRRWTEAKAELESAAHSSGPAGAQARKLLKQGALPPRGGG